MDLAGFISDPSQKESLDVSTALFDVFFKNLNIYICIYIYIHLFICLQYIFMYSYVEESFLKM